MISGLKKNKDNNQKNSANYGASSFGLAPWAMISKSVNKVTNPGIPNLGVKR